MLCNYLACHVTACPAVLLLSDPRSAKDIPKSHINHPIKARLGTNTKVKIDNYSLTQKSDEVVNLSVTKV